MSPMTPMTPEDPAESEEEDGELDEMTKLLIQNQITEQVQAALEELKRTLEPKSEDIE